MPQFTIPLVLAIKARTETGAAEIALGAIEHLLETFNDNGSIKRGNLIGNIDPALTRAPAGMAALRAAAQRLLDCPDLALEDIDEESISAMSDLRQLLKA